MIGLTVLACLALAEGLLRWSGREPWRMGPERFPNEPTLNEFDPVLGWKPKPGAYVFPGYSKGAQPITFTIWPDHSRATAPLRQARDRHVVVVGDSISEGWAVSDSDTYPWKLQERFPDVEVTNYGTAGYGTYQSLLRMKMALKKLRGPTTVIYGSITDHERRNVADLFWLLGMAKGARRGHVYVPYCLLGPTGRLERHPPEGYPVWPFMQSSATVHTLQQLYLGRTWKSRMGYGRPVTHRLFSDMDRTAKLHQARFYVVLLGNVGSRWDYLLYLSSHRIGIIDCALPPDPGTMVPGEGHPNGKRHTQYADCIAKRLERELAVAGP